MNADTQGNTTPAAEMHQCSVLGNRKWAAHLTVDQMRSQIAWEQSEEFAAKKRATFPHFNRNGREVQVFIPLKGE